MLSVSEVIAQGLAADLAEVSTLNVEEESMQFRDAQPHRDGSPGANPAAQDDVSEIERAASDERAERKEEEATAFANLVHSRGIDGHGQPFQSALGTSMSMGLEQVSTNLLSIRPHVLTFTQRPYDYLERKTGQQRRRLVKQSLSVVFHSSSPLAILLRRPAVAFFFLAIATLILYFTFASYLRHQSHVEKLAFRFTPLELRDGSTPIDSPNVARFTIMQDVEGCLQEIVAVRTYAKDEHLYAEFANNTRMDGFAVVTTQSPARSDPVRFVVSGQNEDGSWTAVGFPSWRVLFSGERMGVSERAAVPLHRGEALRVDLRAQVDWPWMVGRVGAGVGVGVGLILAAVSGQLVGVRRVGVGLEVCWVLGACCMLVAAGEFAERGQGGEAALWGLEAVIVVGAAVSLRWGERLLTRILLIMGAALLVVNAVAYFGVLEGGVSLLGALRHGTLAVSSVLCAAFLWVLSETQHEAVAKLVAQDEAAYVEAWQRLQEVEEEKHAVGELEALVEAATAGLSGQGEAAQCHPIEVHHGCGVGADGSVFEGAAMQCGWRLQHAWSTLVYDMPHEERAWLPLGSLDQVYAQAVCLRPILRGKVQAWAAASGGMFAMLDGSFRRWEEIQGDQGLQDSVRWGELKPEARAIEKVIRCYGEDASRLVDVCRQSMVFATVGELVRGLQAIMADDEAELFDGGASAGFRNVGINLRIRDADAKSFGVDSHVCELQLLLLDFAKLQMEEGRHGRYLLFRNYDRPVARQHPMWARWLLARMAPEPRWTVGEEEEGAGVRFRAGGWSFTRGPASRSGAGWSESAMRTAESGSNWAERSTAHGSSQRSLLNAETLSASASLVYDFGRTPASDGGHHGAELLNMFSMSKLNTTNGVPSAGLAPAKLEVMLAFRELLFRRNTSANGNKGHLRDFWAAMEAVSASSVLFIRHPVQGALSKRVWRVVLSLIAVFGLLMTSAVLVSRFLLGSSFQTYRFTSLAVRGQNRSDVGQLPAQQPGIAAFGVSARSCPVRARVERVAEEGAAMTVQYSDQVWMDGFWFVTRNETKELDPIRFVVEGSDDERRWVRVGASGVTDARFFGIRLTDEAFFWTTSRRNQIEHVSVGGWDSEGVVRVLKWQTPVPTFLAVLVCVIRATSGNLDNAWIVGSGLLCTYLTAMVVVPYEWRLAGWKEGLHLLLMMHVFLAMGLTIFFKQHRIFIVAFGGIACTTLIRIVFVTWLIGGGFPVDGPLAMMLVVGMTGFVALVIRVNILRRSRAVVKSDKKVYDELWERIVKDNLDHIRRLDDMVRIQTEAIPRHYYHPFVVSGRSNSQGRGFLVPIKDIDQIYAQATCMHPILLNKVQAWAAASGGMFPSHDGSFVRWGEVMHDPHRRSACKFGQIKKEARAIEKVIRCYGEDVSRLVDVCRQSMVFATVGELVRGLQAIMADDEAELVRVKNRMSLQFDGGASAGFRNVGINLRIRDADAKSFGVDSHVCELQLLLLDFAKLQKSEGHKRYVLFRNVRGE